jgi:hypothetical protein
LARLSFPAFLRNQVVVGIYVHLVFCLVGARDPTPCGAIT